MSVDLDEVEGEKQESRRPEVLGLHRHRRWPKAVALNRFGRFPADPGRWHVLLSNYPIVQLIIHIQYPQMVDDHIKQITLNDTTLDCFQRPPLERHRIVKVPAVPRDVQNRSSPTDYQRPASSTHLRLFFNLTSDRH